MSRFEFDRTASALRIPMGGIGTGTVSLNAGGSFCDWKIADLKGKEINGFTHAAIKCTGLKDDTSFVRVLSDGVPFAKNSAMPVYDSITCIAQYPVARFEYISRDMPCAVASSVFSPFIPLNTADSSLPVIMMKYSVTNLSAQPQDVQLYFSFTNPFSGSCSVGDTVSKTATGFIHKGDEGECVLLTDTQAGAVERQFCWLRSDDPLDSLNCYWTEILTKDSLSERMLPMPTSHADTSTLSVRVTVNPKDTVNIKLALAWNTNMTSTDKSALEIGEYVINNWKRLEGGTDAFKKSLFSSTMPDVAKEAAVSVLPLIKSSIFKKDENGALAVRDDVSYANARLFSHDFYLITRLFPDIERANINKLFNESASLSATENTERLLLNIIRLYAFYRTTHDKLMLDKYFSEVISILERFAESEGSVSATVISAQQKCLDGRLLTAANPYISGLFLCALRAATAMAVVENDASHQTTWSLLLDSAKEAFNAHFFNGNFFAREKGKMPDMEDLYAEQVFVTDGLSAGSHLAQFYGIYHAVMNELDDIFDSYVVKQSLKYIYKEHLVHSMHNIYAPAHSDASLNEGGLLTCIPFDNVALSPRDQGVARGYENMCALLMLLYYLNDQGIDLMILSSERSKGVSKNIYANEPSPFAPSASGFDMVEFYAGFSYDAVDKKAVFSPPFSYEGEARGPWFTSKAWGTFLATANSITIDVLGGAIELHYLQLPLIKKFKRPSPTAGYSVMDDVVIFDDTVQIKAGSRMRLQL